MPALRLVSGIAASNLPYPPAHSAVPYGFSMVLKLSIFKFDPNRL
jgi:hypothetical protein